MWSGHTEIQRAGRRARPVGIFASTRVLDYSSYSRLFRYYSHPLEYRPVLLAPTRVAPGYYSRYFEWH